MFRFMVRHLPGAVLLAGLSLLLPAAFAAADVSGFASGVGSVAAEGGPVVLLGTGGVRWSDVGSDTPALFAALGQDAVGSLAVRNVRESTCPVDGWLAVSAGRRAADTAHPPAPTDVADCRIPAVALAVEGGPGRVTGWDTYRAEATAGRFDADPGLLGATLEAAGVTRAAVGAGAALATADRSGRTPKAWPGVTPGPGGTLDPGGDAVGLVEQVKAALAGGSRFVAVDLGAVRAPGAAAPAGQDEGAGPATRDEQVAGLDTRLGLVLGALPEDATVIIASLADDGTRPHLQVLLANGPIHQTGPTGSGGTFSPGLLRSDSTRQDGLAQPTDLLPTVLTALGVPLPERALGARLIRVDGGDDLQRLRRGLDLDQASLALERVVVPFFVTYGVLEVLVLGTLALIAMRGRRLPVIRRRALTGLRIAGVTFALVPVATFLANLLPWWRSSPAGLPLTLATAAAAAVLAGIAFAGPWRRPLLGPAGVAGALTAVVLAADLVAGSPLSLLGLIGGQPIIAGRFYGLSNPTFALFATGALLAAAALAEWLLARGLSPRQAGLAVAAVGAVVTAIDAAPALGSDVGGPPALVPAFGILALRVAGGRVTWRRLTALAGATIGFLLVVAVTDWLRPADRRTHLGRFVQAVLDGESGLVVLRKAEQNLGLLVSSPVTMLVPVVSVLVAGLLWHPARWRLDALASAYDRQPLLPAALAAVGVLLVLGFVANDSGTSIPPAGFMLLAPLLVAIVAGAVERDDADRDQRALAAALRP